MLGKGLLTQIFEVVQKVRVMGLRLERLQSKMLLGMDLEEVD